MAVRQLFDFVTNVSLTEESADKIIQSSTSIPSGRSNNNTDSGENYDSEEDSDEDKAEKEIREAVFSNKDNVIPRTFKQVANPTGEIFDNQQAFHHAVTGTQPTPS